MNSGAFTAAYNVLASQFEKQTGYNKLTTAFGPSMGKTPQAIPARLAHGEHADVVIMARSALDELVREGPRCER